MATIFFYEKPGCMQNARQKALLEAAGHRVERRNLLTTHWTAERLRSFFGSRPVVEWFNPTAPQIKSGQICPIELDEATALKLTIDDPILIRRPLLQVGDECRVGFDKAEIDAWIGLSVMDEKMGNLETCPRTRTAS
jgi:nitrogenase-associated protein